MRPKLGISESNHDGRRIITVRGELDLGTVHLASDHLDGHWPTREAFLDLSDVTFIDTTGIKFLLDSQREAEAKGRSLVIRNPSARVRATLRISGLFSHLRITTE